MESDLTKFDTIVGDGDCGETFARGATGGCRFCLVCACADRRLLVF